MADINVAPEIPKETEPKTYVSLAGLSEYHNKFKKVVLQPIKEDLYGIDGSQGGLFNDFDLLTGKVAYLAPETAETAENDPGNVFSRNNTFKGNITINNEVNKTEGTLYSSYFSGAAAYIKNGGNSGGNDTQALAAGDISFDTTSAADSKSTEYLLAYDENKLLVSKINKQDVTIGHATTADGFSESRTVSLTGSVIGSTEWNTTGDLSISTKINNNIVLGNDNDKSASIVLGPKERVRQKFEILGDSEDNTDVFRFSQSTDSGAQFKELFKILDTGEIVSGAGIRSNGTIKVDNENGLLVNSNNKDIKVWEVVGNSGSRESKYGFYEKYTGTALYNDNKLVLTADNQSGTHVPVRTITQDGKVTVHTPTTFGSDVSISGNLTVTGETTTLNVTNLDVEDKLISLGIPKEDSESIPTLETGSGCGIQAIVEKNKEGLYTGPSLTWIKGIGWKFNKTLENDALPNQGDEVTASKFKKEGSDNNSVLLGGGDDKKVADFVQTTGNQEISGVKTFNSSIKIGSSIFQYDDATGTLIITT